MASHLLILSCSKSKDHSPGKLPALERYTGRAFSILKNAMKQKPYLREVLDVVIISAKYGFLLADDEIEDYEQRLDSKGVRARELRPGIIKRFKQLFSERHYDVVFVHLGRDYLKAVEGFTEFVGEGTKVIYSKGRGMGEKNQMLKRFLESL
jgi:hypothetical protein